MYNSDKYTAFGVIDVMENSHTDEQTPLRKVRKQRGRWTIIFFQFLVGLFILLTLILIIIGLVNYN
jgi:tetrahydromethanopterin S-methyltransferase subunit B